MLRFVHANFSPSLNANNLFYGSPVTAPARRDGPSMIMASSSTWPSAVKEQPEAHETSNRMNMEENGTSTSYCMVIPISVHSLENASSFIDVLNRWSDSQIYMIYIYICICKWNGKSANLLPGITNPLTFSSATSPSHKLVFWVKGWNMLKSINIHQTDPKIMTQRNNPGQRLSAYV